MSFAVALNQTANKYNKEKNAVIQKVSTQIVDYIKKSCTNTANKGLNHKHSFIQNATKDIHLNLNLTIMNYLLNPMKKLQK